MENKPQIKSKWTADRVAASDGYLLNCRVYAPDGPPRGVVACFHGIQSHAGWYEQSCEHLCDRGYLTYFFDRRGSGGNLRDRGHADSPSVLINDLCRCVEAMKSRVPGVRSAVLGISWGGKLAAVAMGEHPGLGDGLIMAAPGLAAKVGPSLRDRLAIAGSALLQPRRMLPIPLADPTLFTANAERIEFIREDPLALRRASAKLLFGSRLLDRRLRKSASKISAPSLLILAEGDRIIDNVATARLFRTFGGQDKATVSMPGSHTLEFEDNPKPYFDAIADWLDGRIGR